MNHIHDHKCLFVYMNTSISTFCESKLARFVSTMFPALLNTRSTGALVAGIQNNVRTPISRAGYRFTLLRHQTNGYRAFLSINFFHYNRFECLRQAAPSLFSRILSLSVKKESCLRHTRHAEETYILYDWIKHSLFDWDYFKRMMINAANAMNELSAIHTRGKVWVAIGVGQWLKYMKPAYYM